MKKEPEVEFENIKLICPDCGAELNTDVCDNCRCEISLDMFYIDVQPREILN